MNKNKVLDSKLRSKADWSRKQLEAYHEDGLPLVATFVNPFSYQLLADRAELLSYFNLILSDGILHTKLHNYYCKNKIDRVSFDLSSIANDVLERASEKALKVAFIGGKQSHIEVLEENLLRLFPNLIVSYTSNGYMDESKKIECITELKSCSPDIVIVGMGTPLQEEFLISCIKNGVEAKEFYTCGGFIEQTATKGDYYHPVVKKLGLRWLQRAVMHSHVRKRLIIDYPRFVYKYIKGH